MKGKIVVIGEFDSKGMPTGWTFDLNECDEVVNVAVDLKDDGALLGLYDDYVVKVGGVEIVEWTENRRIAVEKHGNRIKFNLEGE